MLVWWYPRSANTRAAAERRASSFWSLLATLLAIAPREGFERTFGSNLWTGPGSVKITLNVGPGPTSHTVTA